jgi:hypothetical protein
MVPCPCPDPVCFATYHHPLSGEPVTLTDAELEEFKRRWEQANTPAARAAHMKREVRRLLPRRARLRLWWRKQLTAAGVRLMNHGHFGACEALWRATGLLR